MIKVGIVGAGGYAGVNLLALLLRHPEVSVSWLVSEDAHNGKKISALFPHLTNICDLNCQTMADIGKLTKGTDVVFLALPHGIALEYVPAILAAGAKVVDLGADYRFDDEKTFEKWYSVTHQDKTVFKEAVFGLPELFRDKIKKTRLVGNPGCYPTASILGTAPLLANKLIDPASIMIDAKSGVSGAGRGLKLNTLYCERNDGVMAYSVTNHRHMGEIDHILCKVAKEPVGVTFVPHLIPQDRGILATIYAKITNDPPKAGQMTNEGIIKLYKDFYKGEDFVRIYPTPCTKNVRGTNYCDIGVEVNEEKGTVIVTSVIDNLIKGAAGQAVQNINLLFGWPETTGLQQIAIFP
ncbi:N-acetyl-gamma-glutamyl-phosphate reductase [Candidatus Saganbacteria bacterium]|nr:N-acetyl-gamma-glutamyl-phosphate reductase [Candidatus Saganbacteria bacterium]